jgi:hypothetical protein
MRKPKTVRNESDLSIKDVMPVITEVLRGHGFKAEDSSISSKNGYVTVSFAPEHATGQAAFHQQWVRCHVQFYCPEEGTTQGSGKTVKRETWELWEAKPRNSYLMTPEGRLDIDNLSDERHDGAYGVLVHCQVNIKYTHHSGSRNAVGRDVAFTRMFDDPKIRMVFTRDDRSDWNKAPEGI